MKSLFNTLSRKVRRKSSAASTGCNAQKSLMTSKDATCSNKTVCEFRYGTAANFGQSLFKLYVENFQGPNCVISPVSLYLCMSMLERGANGETKAELERVLSMSSECSRSEAHDIMATLNESSNPAFKLTVANGLFLQEGFQPLPEFVSQLRTDFNAVVEMLDFGSFEGVNKVNTWAEQETNGKIKEVINETQTRETIMALINAVYMKGKWADCFKESDSKKDDFHVSVSKTVKADLMQQTKEFLYVRDDELKLALTFFPYAGKYGEKSDWEMGILLSEKGSELSDFVQYLEKDSLKTLRLKAKKTRLDVRLPKFRVEAAIDFIPILELMGVQTAFTDNADFSSISSNVATKVSTILQKCYVDVDEQGTEAAAVTVGELREYCLMDYDDGPIKFHVTSPFIFFIFNARCGVVLFCGFVTDPTV